MTHTWRCSTEERDARGVRHRVCTNVGCSCYFSFTFTFTIGRGTSVRNARSADQRERRWHDRGVLLVHQEGGVCFLGGHRLPNQVCLQSMARTVQRPPRAPAATPAHACIHTLRVHGRSQPRLHTCAPPTAVCDKWSNIISRPPCTLTSNVVHSAFHIPHSTFRIPHSRPSQELMPAENIKGMFIADMKGYSDFDSAHFYPRYVPGQSARQSTPLQRQRPPA